MKHSSTWNIRRARYVTASARPKPAGGFCFIPAASMLRVWVAYQRSEIRLCDLRIWFSCHELVARRCGARVKGLADYSTCEIQTLVGCADELAVHGAIRRLERAGLLFWSQRKIRLPEFYVEDGEGVFAEMLDLVANHRRKVPVPRRTIRFLAAARRPALIATILGHLLRCLYYRNGVCAPEGRCKASWIADAFCVDIRSVKAARQHLLQIGWIVREMSGQTAMNRWGARLRVNLEWADTRARVGVSKPPPPPREFGGRFSPPVRDRELSPRPEYQKPPSACGTGAHRAVQDAPALNQVRLCDLIAANRLEILFQEALWRGLASAGEAGRLRFYAAATHAVRVGTTNPPGLFAAVVRRQLWSHISLADEESARGLLRTATLLERAVHIKTLIPRSLGLPGVMKQGNRLGMSPLGPIAQRVLRELVSPSG